MLDPARRGLEKGVIEGVVQLKPGYSFPALGAKLATKNPRQFDGAKWSQAKAAATLSKSPASPVLGRSGRRSGFPSRNHSLVPTHV